VKTYPPLVADAPVPPPLPAAIRITRPYASEDDFLDRELDTFTRASITLLGAQSRPQGVVLRFELVLASGQVLVRGEGRVVAFKANAFEGLGGLTLRFTRLDTKSKALVDRAAALREQRRPSTRPPTHDTTTPDPMPLPPPPPTLPGMPRPAPQESGVVAFEADAAPQSEPSLPLARPSAPSASSADAPERDSLLERLRRRAKALDAGDIQRILAGRQRR
jgi:hypothetical protein